MSDQDLRSSLERAIREGDIEKRRRMMEVYYRYYPEVWSEAYVLFQDAVRKSEAVTESLLARVSKKMGRRAIYACTPLHFAIINRDAEIVQLLLEKGADINATTTNDKTPLHIAIEEKCGAAVVKLLLPHEADVDKLNKFGKTVLYLAVKSECLEVVEVILKNLPNINNRGNKDSFELAVLGSQRSYRDIVKVLLEYGFRVHLEDPNYLILLHAAVEKGYLKIVKDLLKDGADVNNSRASGVSLLHNAVQNKQKEVAKLLISYKANINAKDGDGNYPIFYAIEAGDLELAKLLLPNGAPINDSGHLLRAAVRKGLVDIVEVLLQNGANVNQRDSDGRTALYLTASSTYNGEIMGRIVKLLLSKGADVDAQYKNGKTALHRAIRAGCAIVIEVLLRYNANVNIVTKRGFAPLHICAQCGDEKLITILLNKGANINAKLDDGTNALHIATRNGNNEVVKALLKLGVKVDCKNESGMTELHIVSERHCRVIIDDLLKFGADIDHIDECGRTPLYVMSKNRNVEAVRTLLKYGADVNIADRTYQTPLNFVSFFHSQHPKIRRIRKDLRFHTIKMRTANLFVVKKNLFSMFDIGEIDFQNKCKAEVGRMKSEKINNTNISFYDVLVKNTAMLEIYMRNESTVKILESGDYKINFPIYASMVENRIMKGVERQKLQGHKIIQFLMNNLELPSECIENILSYLSNRDLKILINLSESREIINC